MDALGFVLTGGGSVPCVLMAVLQVVLQSLS